MCAHWRILRWGGHRGRPLLSPVQIFFHLHAVFRKNWPYNRFFRPLWEHLIDRVKYVEICISGNQYSLLGYFEMVIFVVMHLHHSWPHRNWFINTNIHSYVALCFNILLMFSWGRGDCSGELFFFKIFGGHQSFLWGHLIPWYPPVLDLFWHLSWLSRSD